MRVTMLGIIIAFSTSCLLGGCAKKEVVMAEEPIAPAAVTAPVAPPPPAPEVPRVVLPPETKRAEAIPPPVILPPSPQPMLPVEKAPVVSLETIHFDFDKSDLREPDREILVKNADIMMKKLQGNVLIEGHCDERGSDEYNLALGERRALSALKYLVTLGVSANRLSWVSFGEEKPFDPGHDEEAWAKNRRAQFVILGE